MVRSTKEFVIDYRHIIDSLLRKPGAFQNYKYRESLFPRLVFRKAYDFMQKQLSKKKTVKNYLELLHLAKLNGEQNVSEAMQLYLDENKLPLSEEIKLLLDNPIIIPNVTIKQPELSAYDKLKKGAVQ